MTVTERRQLLAMNMLKPLLTLNQLDGKTVAKVTQRAHTLAIHFESGEAVVLRLDNLEALDASWLDQSDVAKLELEA